MRLVLRVRTAIPPYLTPYSYPHQLAGAKESAKTNAAKAAAYRAASSGEEIMSELISNVQTRSVRAPAVFEDPREKRQVLVDEAIRKAFLARAAAASAAA